MLKLAISYYLNKYMNLKKREAASLIKNLNIIVHCMVCIYIYGNFDSLALISDVHHSEYANPYNMVATCYAG